MPTIFHLIVAYEIDGVGLFNISFVANIPVSIYMATIA